MQRLSRQAGRERGAVAVTVALLMVPILGFAAISIDVAAMWSQQQTLRVGTDAAALALAQACAKNSCDSNPAQAATDLITANYGAGATSAVVSPSPLTPTSGTVTVRTSTVSNFLFAPILGHDSSEVPARSTATWGSPSGGTAILPLTFSWCEWFNQTGGGVPNQTTERVIFFSKDSGASTCKNQSGNIVPGGFAWVDPSASQCALTSTTGQQLSSKTGSSMPTTCSATYFTSQLNKIILLPLFQQSGGTGTNAWYQVYGYAAFVMTGYVLGNASYNSSGCESAQHGCIKGYFTQFVDPNDAFTYSTSAPNLGGEVVSLVP